MDKSNRGVRKKKLKQKKKKHLITRKGSLHYLDTYSCYSDSDSEASPDEAYPRERSSSSAFSNKLSLFSPQKLVSKRVSREAVVETVFSALFSRKNSNRQNAKSVIDCSDTDSEINEDFLKRGLTLSLFHDDATDTDNKSISKNEDPLRRYVDAKLIHKLVNELRFEDFRTPSARIDILRAITKHCSYHRITVIKALTDATYMRMKFTVATEACFRIIEFDPTVESNKRSNDHSHGFIELLRFLIEVIGESVNGFLKEEKVDCPSIYNGLIRCFVHLCVAHCSDSSGSEEDELIDCAGQLVAYLPFVSIPLMQRLLSCWPVTIPSAEVLFIRILARILMSTQRLDLVDHTTSIHITVFHKLMQCITSEHVQVSKEALEFTGSPFVLEQYVAPFQEIYSSLVKALHQSKRHWNPIIQEIAEEQFDLVLDFA